MSTAPSVSFARITFGFCKRRMPKGSHDVVGRNPSVCHEATERLPETVRFAIEWETCFAYCATHKLREAVQTERLPICSIDNCDVIACRRRQNPVQLGMQA